MPQLIRFIKHISTHAAENLEKFSRADENFGLAVEIFPRLQLFHQDVSQSILIFPSSEFFLPDMPFMKTMMGFDQAVVEDAKEGELKCYSTSGDSWRYFGDYYENR
jgi:hypothetical protein